MARTRGDRDLADDLTSEVILWALENPEKWADFSAGHLAAYLKTVLKFRFLKSLGRIEISFDDIVPKSDDAEEADVLEWLGGQPPRQDDFVFAQEMMRSIAALPDKHRSVIVALGDGATPLDVAAEMGVALHTVMRIIREARKWVHDGYLETGAAL